MSPIARLQGIVQEAKVDSLVVLVGGVGYLVRIPLSLLAAVDEQVDLHTHLVAKENDISLYGFRSAKERGLFQLLIGVSGVGPKMALALLSSLSPDELTAAIATGDPSALTRAPGLGQKLASRIVLELSGKLVAEDGALLSGGQSDVVEALMSLGYNRAEAAEAVARSETSPGAEAEERLRLALSYLGRSEAKR